MNETARPQFAHRTGSPRSTANAATLAQLNDAFRRSFVGGRVVETASVVALPEAERIAVLLAVRRFDSFDADNDPHGEHEFGVVEVGGRRFFRKIDAYDHAMHGNSPDPIDLAVTARVLTIMLAEDY